jgi:hypothetical protein
MSVDYNPTKYKPHVRYDRYEAELNRLVKKIKLSDLYAFTDEENIQINKDLSEGLNEFLSAEIKREVESALELKTIILNQ